MTLEQLRALMPQLPEAMARLYLPHLNAAMAEARINTPRRQAAFLAQVAFETGELRWMEELASGEAYEGRKDLGNLQRGDGVRFKGRGALQLTGRDNYTRASRALRVDLVANPKRAADPDLAFRIAGWFWTAKGLNVFADDGNFDAITLRINGGFNGKPQRDAYYRRAREIFGAR